MEKLVWHKASTSMNCRTVSKANPREKARPMSKVLLNELNHHIMDGIVGAFTLAVALRMIPGSAETRDSEALVKPIKNLCREFLAEVRQNCGRH